ncbi:hypothetical protein HBI56_076870 [Parastagonospora nodorum]|nr:hypothetical protein HBH53_137760 [Parastagonospora nodorum]KAH3983740.1 hypothetical protein HBH52_062200 [Parastagonospora nodorum]KAH3985928.1 hypothetical protein HBH51_021010 [Parastagonospora nodorum]KAH4003311.1 hypothetical protein HBI10_060180 [Parastagonospora nodorum]KAH4028928.1 hypothetical protein HBI13_042190 [Parastagonospora nodorum]
MRYASPDSLAITKSRPFVNLSCHNNLQISKDMFELAFHAMVALSQCFELGCCVNKTFPNFTTMTYFQNTHRAKARASEKANSSFMAKLISQTCSEPYSTDLLR